MNKDLDQLDNLDTDLDTELEPQDDGVFAPDDQNDDDADVFASDDQQQQQQQQAPRQRQQPMFNPADVTAAIQAGFAKLGQGGPQQQQPLTPEQKRELFQEFEISDKTVVALSKALLDESSSMEDRVKSVREFVSGVLKEAKRYSELVAQHHTNQFGEQLKPLNEYVTKAQAQKNEAKFLALYPDLKPHMRAVRQTAALLIEQAKAGQINIPENDWEKFLAVQTARTIQQFNPSFRIRPARRQGGAPRPAATGPSRTPGGGGPSKSVAKDGGIWD